MWRLAEGIVVDVVVTVPKDRWQEWLDEGDLPGDPRDEEDEDFYAFSLRSSAMPEIAPGERVYVVAHGKLRGFAPLDELTWEGKLFGEARKPGVQFALVRGGGAVAVTIAEPIIGFMGWRYRWWDRGIEVPFRDWKTP